MRTPLPAFLLAIAAGSLAFAADDLIPRPVESQPGTGSFRLEAGTPILVSPGAEARGVGEFLANALAAPTGFRLKVSEADVKIPRRRAIVLALDPAGSTRPQGYVLDVSPRGVRIEASSAAGLFYGARTLIALLPPEVESAAASAGPWMIPAIRVADYPRFGWRGLLLDVSRHFFTKEYLKRYIDQMARYKFNVLQLHLTDDNGWRLEIKSLPELTKVGAWRVPRIGRWGSRPAPEVGEAASYGGFYTQEDMREIIAYAKSRFVTILPEIEMPGHAMAALASYPEISCTGGPFRVNPGSAFYTKEDNALCPGNEKTFEFMDKVLAEVAALFPSEYVHIGGDECYKGFWKACPKCQRRIEEEHLKNEDELQSYLIRRAERMLAAKGKKLIGWDEILEGGLAPNATVMSWRGMSGGIAAAKMNHSVVMSPTNYAYIDYYQGDPTLEPDTFGRLLLNTVYKFEPVPEGVDSKFILGGQGNLWSESVPTPRHADYMTWPRAFALAEVLWSGRDARDWDGFARRVEENFARLDAAEVNYSRAMFDVSMAPVRSAAGKLAVRMSTELSGCDIYYTFDSTNPDRFTLKYAGEPVEIPVGADVVKAVAWRDGHASGRVLALTIAQLEKRLPKPRQ